MIDAVLTLSDGRHLSYTDVGPPGAPVVLYFHGTPTSRLDVVHLDDVFAEIGVRVVSADRPGFGHSSLRPRRTLADTADDVTELAAVLDVERFAVLGASTGGPHAIVTAALMADRVVGLGCLAGQTDAAWGPFWEGTPPEVEAMLRRGDEVAFTERLETLFGADGSGFPSGTAGLPPADAALFDDPATASRFRASTSECFRQGVTGFAHDTVVRSQPWTFDPAAITAPTWIYHGEQDTIRPVAHSEHTATLIPSAQVVRFSQHGHLSLWDEIPSLVANLVRPLN